MIVSSLWDVTSSWLTPTSLFVLLNLVIATIAVTSRRTTTTPGKPYEHHNQQRFSSDIVNSAPQLTRAPSLLDRVKSINFSLYKFDGAGNFPQASEPDPYSAPVGSPKLERAPSLLERVWSFNFSLYRSEQPEPEPVVPSLEPEQEVHLQEQQVMKRSKSSEAPAQVGPAHEKMKKSNSEKTASSTGRRREEKESEETVERRRPATTRIEKTVSFSNDEEINVKADDFINRFKQQLRLQRLDSILRYKEMLNKSSAKEA